MVKRNRKSLNEINLLENKNKRLKKDIPNDNLITFIGKGRKRGCIYFIYLADIFYDNVIVDGVKYSIGDKIIVEISSNRLINGNECNLCICEIESIWKDEYHDKWFESRWFYFPEEIKGGRKECNGDQYYLIILLVKYMKQIMLMIIL